MSSVVWLDVPFPEKDEAKALGARFDFRDRKRWYVPAGMDPAPFERWLPKGAKEASSGPAARGATDAADTNAPKSEGATRGISLGELLGAVQATVRAAHGRGTWVRAEVTGVQTTRAGHTYLELVDYDASGREQAKARGAIWKSKAGMLESFAKATGMKLEAGVKVLLLARVDLHPRFGLSLMVEDIDPSFTLGDMAARLAEMRKALQAEGLYERNRRLMLPGDFCRVAVIAPAGAAGLGDFRTRADALAELGLCEFFYLEATFQGDAAAASVAGALEGLRKRLLAGEAFDAAVVIRGGGDKAGLYALNDLAIARALCRLPIPVLVGIGHERDETILDEVARLRFPTPSMVSAHIAQTIVDNASAAREAMLVIEKLAGGQLAAARERQERERTQMRELAAALVHRARQSNDALAAQVQQQALALVARARDGINREQQALHALPGHLLERARHQAQALVQEVLAANPHRILGQGYAIARNARGEALRSTGQVSVGEAVSLELADGRVHTEVTSTDPRTEGAKSLATEESEA